MDFNFEHLFTLLEQAKFEEVFDYIGKYIPKRLYKYYSLFDEDSNEAIKRNERKFKTLSENKIWLSDFKMFNDPFEAKNFYTDIQKLKQYGYDDKDLETVKFTQDLIESTYKVASLSTHLNDCMPMWAHYANNYKGYCVEYEVLNTRAIFPVFYENTRNASTIIPKILNGLLKCGNNPTQEMQNEVLKDGIVLMLSYCIKHKSWEYEDEFRVLIPEIDNLKTCEELGLKPVKIYTGLNTAETHINRLQEISQNIGLGDVVRCSISDNEYLLNFE